MDRALSPHPVRRFGRAFRWGDVDFAAVGGAFGFTGIRITEPERLRDGLLAALEADKPAVVDVVVSSEETPLFAYEQALATGQKTGYAGNH